MNPEPSPTAPVDDEVEALADAEGLNDIEAGRVVSGEAVKRWLRSWGTDKVLPTPRIGD
ncbi:MAG: CopG family transcriptional regulator [Caulobacter sp.]